MNSPHKGYLTAREAGDVLLVSPVTVRKWAQKGALPFHSTLGGHRRFLMEDLHRFAEQHGIRLADTVPTDATARILRILLVDDDTIFTDYVREIVLRASPGASVECAADGFEAGKLSEALHPQLVAMDINMPGIGGIELCRRLRNNPTTAQARLIVMSGEMTAENAAAARAAGADACIGKGATRDDMLAALGLALLREANTGGR